MADLDTVLFGKYRLCRILGTGRLGTVFLAVHLGLFEYRAIKRVQKSSLEYDQFRREALILKELRHPGIPIVYDIEEDEDGNRELRAKLLEYVSIVESLVYRAFFVMQEGIKELQLDKHCIMNVNGLCKKITVMFCKKNLRKARISEV